MCNLILYYNAASRNKSATNTGHLYLNFKIMIYVQYIMINIFHKRYMLQSIYVYSVNLSKYYSYDNVLCKIDNVKSLTKINSLNTKIFFSSSNQQFQFHLQKIANEIKWAIWFIIVHENYLRRPEPSIFSPLQSLRGHFLLRIWRGVACYSIWTQPLAQVLV